ncbi:MAG: hypothetical protein ACREIQ_08530 [Nitrospiria bacterium]
MLLALVLAVATSCTATTNIEEFKDDIKNACKSPGAESLLKNVDFSGNHDEATFSITYQREHKYLSVPETELGRIAWESAITSHGILFKLYPMKKFNYILKEPDGSIICEFSFGEVGEAPLKASCKGLVQ